jgi:uncharacterized protein (UPF0179 family)
MVLVTLIGEKLAKVENIFTYIGPNNECRNCKLKTVCFNLKTGRKYKITSIREKRHNCNVHEGVVVVVEVTEMPIITSGDKKLSKGSKGKIEKKECNNIGCDHYEICNIELQKEKEYTITDTFEIIECPLGYDIKKVELSDE